MSLRLPVRVELKDRETKHTCNITLLYDFVDSPAKGDYIIFKQSALTVSGRCHYYDGGVARLVIITSSYEVSKYDDMLMILDWFKENYEIFSIESDALPENYYNLYRSIINVLKWKDAAAKDFKDKKIIRAFTNAAIAILMHKCNITTEEAMKQCKPWGDLLILMILERNQLDDFRIITVIRDWHAKLKQLTVIDDDWIIDIERCVDNLAHIQHNEADDA